MNSKSDTYQVAVVGGGPVGLFLGICLVKAGIETIILEKNPAVHHDSRSLGIHPVSLELFQQLDIADLFTKEGVKIFQGHAFANTRKLGTLSFGDCPEPFNYILALPQHHTEAILEQKLTDLSSDILSRGTEVIGITEEKDHVEIEYRSDSDDHRTLKSQYLVGADGKNSFVRDHVGISFKGMQYPDTYIMGDFTDNTDFGPDAAIYLCDDGLIESFPLQHSKRRWVVKTQRYISGVNRKDIEVRVKKRIDHNLNGTENVMLSSFGVQKMIANPMVKNRIILAGDAAHVVSPIGGQGMNLGWLGARDLAQCLDGILKNGLEEERAFQQFAERRQKAAINAGRRGEMNMRLGREANFPALRNGLIWLMLNTPLSQFMSRLFTMRGIERWVI